MTPCIRRAWRSQLDNPALPIIVYLAVVGVLAVLSGGQAPDAVADSTPRWLTQAWALSLAVGGCLAVTAGMTGRTRGESAGLALVTFGLGLYGLAVVLDGHPDSDGVETIAALTALIACCAIRMRVLHLARRAQRVARCMRRERRPPWTS